MANVTELRVALTVQDFGRALAFYRDALGLEQIAATARAAGLADVEVTACGDRVIAPALRLATARLETLAGAPVGQREAARLLLWQVGLLWRRGIIDYLLLRAIRP